MSSTRLQCSKNSFMVDQLENNKLVINHKVNVEITHGNVSQHSKVDDHFKGNKIINIKYSIIMKQKCMHFKSPYKINKFKFDSNSKLSINVMFCFCF